MKSISLVWLVGLLLELKKLVTPKRVEFVWEKILVEKRRLIDLDEKGSGGI